MNSLRSSMPTLARHEGTWEGHYRYFDASGALIDQHASRLICRLPDDGPYPYHQTNIYRWADGRSETRDFPATWRDGKLHWAGDGATGWAIEVGEDPHARTLMLYWAPQDRPGSYVYELIQISDCGRFRSRMWQWIEDGRVKLRTLIDEQRVDAG